MSFQDVLAEENRKAQQLAAARQQQERINAYNTKKAQLDNQYNNGGLGGFLGGLIGGIGKGISDIGKGTLGVIGGGVAGVKDLLEGTAGTQENQNAFKRWLFDAETDKDAAAKAAGTALNAATTLATTAVPGLGAGSTAAKALGGVTANTIGGAVGGVADEFQQQGANASLESAINRGISGAVAGAATGGLNRKIGNATGNLSSKLLNNRLATSTIGRGALSGAVGGATGAGTSAALGGGDIAQAALQGGLSGAVSGATQAGVMAGANRALQGAKSRLGFNAQQSTQQTTAEEPFAAYGESKLAKRTKGTQTAEAIRRFGNTLEGAQTNVTRAAARDMGIESTGKVVENVRKKTGLTNLETQAQLAKELTGGADSLMDNIQRNALSATEDGSGRYLADQTKVLGEIDGIVDKYATTSSLGEKGIQNLKDQLRTDILNQRQDLLSKSNNFKSQAQELRGKGIVNPSEGDSAKAKIYTEVAQKLDDLSYNAIPKENVKDMFDATISEMRTRAAQAQANGNKDIANAYNKLADSLNEQPRTIKAYRSFKKDFVDISKINTLTGQAENGAAVQMNSGLLGGLKRFGNKVAERPANAALAKVGGAVNQVADLVDNLGTTSNGTPVQPISQNTQNILGNLIGRTEGIAQADNMVQNARKAQDYQNLEDMFGGNPNLDTSLTDTLTSAQQTKSQAQLQSEAQLADIANGMQLALAAGDIASYNKLEDLYQSAYKMYQLQYPTQESTESKMTTAEKNQIAKLQSAGTALDELESLYEKAGGGQGIIGGNIANFLGGLGLNSDVNTYNQLAQGLINQIGAAIGKTDSLNTEGEVQRALSLVPKITDDNQTAMNKLATLRQLLQTNTGTYNELYGA